MTDIQQAIARLRAADDQHPDFWVTIRDRDSDPQMLRDVVALARAYVRKETQAHESLRYIKFMVEMNLWPQESIQTLHDIASKAAEGLGE